MASTAIYTLSMERIKAIIEALSLTNIHDEIRVTKHPSDGEELQQGISICPARTKPYHNDGVNYLDDIGYPVAIWFVDTTNSSLTTDLDRTLLWHETVRRKLIHTQVATPDWPASVYDVGIDPNPPYDEKIFDRNDIDVGFLMAIVWSREGRL